MSKRVAFFTFGRLRQPFGHAEVQGFVDRVPGVYAAADSMEGFVDRSKRSMDDYSHSWGPIVTPKCWGTEDLGKTAATLSIWEDLESVTAFAYHGPHGDALQKRTEWFQPNELPEHTAWWIADCEEVDWQTAAERMDHLHEHGPSGHAFSLKKPFGPDGQPYKLNAERIRQKAATKP